jgi:hypothetical protein
VFKDQKSKRSPSSASDSVSTTDSYAFSAIEKAGRSTPFPRRLLGMIRREAVSHPAVVRWSRDGCAFFIDDEELFISSILPR